MPPAIVQNTTATGTKCCLTVYLAHYNAFISMPVGCYGAIRDAVLNLPQHNLAIGTSCFLYGGHLGSTRVIANARR